MLLPHDETRSSHNLSLLSLDASSLLGAPVHLLSQSTHKTKTKVLREIVNRGRFSLTKSLFIGNHSNHCFDFLIATRDGAAWHASTNKGIEPAHFIKIPRFFFQVAENRTEEKREGNLHFLKTSLSSRTRFTPFQLPWSASSCSHKKAIQSRSKLFHDDCHAKASLP
jgi:hypothetical protein